MTSSTLLSAADQEQLRTALVDVVEQSFFAYTEFCTAQDVEDDARLLEQWLRARISFSSERLRGSLELVVPGELAIELAAAFSGTEPGDLGMAMVSDLAGELCNMICGLWLTRTRPNDRFFLAPPQVAAAGYPAAAFPWIAARVNGRPIAFLGQHGDR